MDQSSHLHALLADSLGPERAEALLALVRIDPALAVEAEGDCSRAVLAEALNLVLLDRLIEGVPSARAYIGDLAAASRRLDFDHGALRTVDLPAMGALPRGEAAITRVLLPLGYELAETYPLDRLGMTGRAYRHADFPEDIPQFFVSELHVDRFSEGFQAAAARVTETSRDPLLPKAERWLAHLGKHGSLPLDEARELLPVLANCFGRHHLPAHRADYEVLLAESAEMAWIATEGNAFNHATDRVPDIEGLAAQQRRLGRAIKDAIEISASGRVRQTAYRADRVTRDFVDANGQVVVQDVPGSFFEFITRDRLPGSEQLDLSFDTSNAQGIFRMTAAA